MKIHKQNSDTNRIEKNIIFRDFFLAFEPDATRFHTQNTLYHYIEISTQNSRSQLVSSETFCLCGMCWTQHKERISVQEKVCKHRRRERRGNRNGGKKGGDRIGLLSREQKVDLHFGIVQGLARL